MIGLPPKQGLVSSAAIIVCLAAAGCALPEHKVSAQSDADDNGGPVPAVVVPDLDPNTFNIADTDRFALVIAGDPDSDAELIRATVPATAVIRLRGRDWIFTPSGNGRFTRLEVVPGRMLKHNKIEIVSGLDPGTEVVANAFAFQQVIKQ